MKIRQTSSFDGSPSRATPSSAAEAIAELDAQYATGELEAHAYLTKKRGLVRAFLKQTTSPRRRPRAGES
ncbi:hypothetical protein MUN78_08785 [Leucobacter allii]|uniref:SHOCT domain-containing protein n=1 Tax=Leucobacter allii TaxID=2932247 RepID=A0ABY4FGJ7_9MICO|nr:hypothetical protein [Leucobacter allii]UOQ55809.1 hypothetical protein MUN78_08785 [Leucobacter allii]